MLPVFALVLVLFLKQIGTQNGIRMNFHFIRKIRSVQNLEKIPSQAFIFITEFKCSKELFLFHCLKNQILTRFAK